MSWSVSLGIRNTEVGTQKKIEQECLFNHQKWQITLSIDNESKDVRFWICDRSGKKILVSNYIFSDIETGFLSQIVGLSCYERNLAISQYIEARLENTSPYEVHIENVQGSFFVHFGAYGLPGGVTDKKKVGICASSVQVILGTGLFISGNPLGLMLIGSGASGGGYLLKSGEDIESGKFISKSLVGGAASSIFVGATLLSAGATAGYAIAASALGGAGSTVISDCGNELIDKNQLPEGKQIIKGVISGGSSGLLGGVVGEGLGSIMKIQKFAPRSISNVFKQFVKYAGSSGGSAVAVNATNYCFDDNSTATDEFVKNVLFSAIIGGTFGTLMSTLGNNYQYWSIKKTVQDPNFKTQFLELLENNQIQNDIVEKTIQDIDDLIENVESAINQLSSTEVANGIVKFPVDILKTQLRLLNMSKEVLKLISNFQTFGSVCQLLYSRVDLLIQATNIKIENIQRSVSGNLINFNKVVSDMYQNPVAPVNYVEVDWEEIVNHIVLVHGIDQNNFIGHLSEELLPTFDFEKGIADNGYKTLFTLKHSIVQDGTIARHLTFEGRAFSAERFIDRPTLHWVWNQLVQPHGSYTWENVLIGIIEPFKILENNENKAYGIAPYDTMTIGAHRLSEISTILLPKIIKAESEQHLTRYRGRIHYFDSTETTLRSAIDKEIVTHYPEAWSQIDLTTGEKIGNKPRHTRLGYEPFTCFERPDGTRVLIISESGNGVDLIRQPSMRERKRYIGLHHNCLTCVGVEDDTTIKKLKIFKEDPISIKGDQSFAGFANEDVNFKNLVAFKSVKLFNKSLSYNEKMKLNTFCDYLLEETFQADLVSVYYNYFDFSEDLGMPFTSHKRQLMVKTIKNLLRESIEKLIENLLDPQLAQNYFGEYLSILRFTIENMKHTEETVLEIENINGMKERNEIFENQLDAIKNGENLDSIITQLSGFEDFQQVWPFDGPIIPLINKIRSNTSDDLQLLQQFYQYISEKENSKLLEFIQHIIYLKMLEISFISGIQGEFPSFI
ncbi:MAG: hypothetical protein ChlgKO_02610 [Chlamydiales bacterium]